MLVLSRQRDETIMIGDDIEITVVDIRGDKVRLGINAPTSIAVHRKEIYEAIKAENKRAATISASDSGVFNNPSLPHKQAKASPNLSSACKVTSPKTLPVTQEQHRQAKTA